MLKPKRLGDSWAGAQKAGAEPRETLDTGRVQKIFSVSRKRLCILPCPSSPQTPRASCKFTEPFVGLAGI